MDTHLGPSPEGAGRSEASRTVSKKKIRETWPDTPFSLAEEGEMSPRNLLGDRKYLGLGKTDHCREPGKEAWESQVAGLQRVAAPVFFFWALRGFLWCPGESHPSHVSQWTGREQGL